MKKQFLINAISCVVFANVLFSCTKKDKDSVTPDLQNNCRLLSEKEHESGDSAIYIYNQEGKLIRIQRYNNHSDSSAYETFFYETGKIIHLYYNNDKTLNTKEEFFINANGTVSKQVRTANDPNVTIDDTLFYTYDGNGYNTLVVDKSYHGGAFPSATIDSTWKTYTNGDNTYSVSKFYNSGNIKPEEYIYIRLHILRKKIRVLFFTMKLLVLIFMGKEINIYLQPVPIRMKRF